MGVFFAAEPGLQSHQHSCSRTLRRFLHAMAQALDGMRDRVPPKAVPILKTMEDALDSGMASLEKYQGRGRAWGMVKHDAELVRTPTKMTA
jgi:hypothetical protein